MQVKPRHIAARDYHAHRAFTERRAATAAGNGAARRAHLALALQHEFAGYCVRLRRSGAADASDIGAALRAAYPVMVISAGDDKTPRAISALTARPGIGKASAREGVTKAGFVQSTTRHLQRWLMRRQRSSTLGHVQSIEAEQASRSEEASDITGAIIADHQADSCTDTADTSPATAPATATHVCGNA